MSKGLLQVMIPLCIGAAINPRKLTHIGVAANLDSGGQVNFSRSPVLMPSVLNTRPHDTRPHAIRPHGCKPCNCGIANAPRYEGAALADGAPRSGCPHFVRLANAARGPQCGQPLTVPTSGDTPLQNHMHPHPT
eukprot:241316-Chlamydomonas_euryale.AAC.3